MQGNEFLIKISYTFEDQLEELKISLSGGNYHQVMLPAVEQDQLTDFSKVREAAESEYREEEYYSYRDVLDREWNLARPKVLEAFYDSPIKFLPEYRVVLTKYGAGGSYTLPNTIRRNIYKFSVSQSLGGIVHEAIHIAIHNLIEEYKIPHWQKERIVDLIFKKHLPELANYKKEYNNAPEVDPFFEKYYPDVERITQELSQLEQKTI